MKSIILKVNVDGSIEPFTSLPKLFTKYPELEKHTDNINSHFSRLKKDFQQPEFFLRKCLVNN